MAEIEHYVDPLDKRHARFGEVKHIKLMLLSKDVQVEGRTDLKEMSVGDAVAAVSCFECAISLLSS
jgi:glycyl-tRNA synthetase